MNDHPNPMRREGLLGRVAPFTVAGLLAVPVAGLEADSLNVAAFIAAAALTLAIVASPVLPWKRFPVSLQAGPPIAFLLAAGLLRYAVGVTFFGYGMLMLLPVIWLALYGTRRELAVVLAVGTLLLLVPIAVVGPPDYPVVEALLEAVLWLVMATLVGITIQRLVQDARRRAVESAGQAQKLGEAQAQFVQRFENAPIGMATVGLDGRVMLFNAAYAQMLGRSGEEIAGADFEQFSDPSDRDGHESAFAALSAGELSTHQAEKRLVHKDGHAVDCIVSVTPITGSDGRLDYFFAQFQDISELRRAERELRRLADIVRASDDAILGCRTNGTVTSWNPGAEQLFGYSAEEMIGQAIPVLVPDDRAGEETAVLKRVLSGEVVQGHETQAVIKSGEIIDVALTVSPIKGASGKVTAISLIASDLTDRKRGQEEADRLKSEFFSLVSHEFRTPLTSIVGYVDVLLERDLQIPQAKQSQFLEVIKRNSERLLRLVGDLLLVSKMQDDQFAIVPREIDLEELVTDAMAAAAPSAAEAGLELVTEIESAPVWGDADRLAQLLDNLIANAVKYTPAGETVTVRLRADGGQAVLDVTNSGVQIPSAELEHLFEPFFRASNVRGGAKQGAGLGLVITKRIVEAHGGQIRVTSEPDTGTTFHVTLPLPDVPRLSQPRTLDRAAA